MREITLSGSEISVIKALGVSGTPTPGTQLLQRITDMEESELVDALQGLMMTGFVTADRENVRNGEEMKNSSFQVNTSYRRELRTALNPALKEKPQRRRRRG